MKTLYSQFLQQTGITLDHVLDSIQDGISIIDRDLKVIAVNKTMETWYSHVSPLLNRHCYEVYHGRSEPCEICPTIRSLRSGESDFEVVPLTGPDGVEGWLELFTFPMIKEETGEVEYIIEHVRDITQRKMAEDRLAQSNVQLALSQFALENAGDAIFLTRPDGRVWYVNEAACKSLGYEKDELLGMTIFDIDPEFPRERWPQHWAELQELGSMNFETRHRRKDGVILPVEVTTAYFKYGGEEYNVGFARDITDRKKAEVERTRTLKEKEVLLSEMHHRVKNNLALIQALLRLQSRSIDDERAIEILSESQKRIHSIALVHEKLYQREDLASIDFKDYVESICSHLLSAHGKTSEEVNVALDIDEVTFGPDVLIPCGLIMNELINNSLKYAFKNTEAPEIEISLKAHGEDVILCVGDNGSGLPEDVGLKGAKSLGFDIVNQLVGQLKGRVEIDRTRGTLFRISFKIPGNK